MKVGLKLEYSNPIVDEERKEGVQYGSWHKTRDYTIGGLVITTNDPDHVVNFPVIKNKTYYALYVIYSTGDSFGREENVLSIVDIFKSLEEATEVQKLIEQNHEKSDGSNKYGYILKYKNNGMEKSEYCSWNGYFEHITSVDIQPVQLK